MSNNNFLSGRDKELQELAGQYEAATAKGQPIYLDSEDWADLADWYGMKKKFTKALEIAEYGLTLHPDSTTLLIEYAYLFLDSGQREKAREIVEGLSDTYSPEAKVLRAHLLLSENKLEEAEQLLDTIEDKSDLANVVDVSYMYLDTGYPDKALAWLEPVKERYHKEESYIAVIADCLYGKRMVDDAIPLYNQLIDRNPYSAPYWFGLARCLFEKMNVEQTMEACDYALVADDEFTEAYMLKGHCFYQLGNEDAALECYQKAEQLQSITPELINMYIGLCKMSKEEWKEAFENLDKAAKEAALDEKLSVLLPNIYIQAGLCLAKLGKMRKAHIYCKRAHKLAPNDPESHLIEGRLYIEEGDYTKGVKQWAEALKCSPCIETWNEIGIICMEIGYLDYAKIALEQVAEMDPDFEGVNERLTIIYMTLRDKKNFHKYNKRCARPLDLKELEKIQALLQKEDHEEELFEFIHKILMAIKF